jgi:probable HAF family extracellular repeat protein
MIFAACHSQQSSSPPHLLRQALTTYSPVEDAVKQRILIAFLLLLVPIAGAQVYRITDLGPLSPTAINTWDQVVGDLNGHAFIWTQSAGLKDLGTLPGGTFSSATAINDLGQVAGAGDLPTAYCDGFYITQTVAFLWTRSHGMQSLGSVEVAGIPACVFSSYASDINVLGQVAGTQGKSSTTYVDAFLWTKAGGMTLVPGGVYNNAAYGINSLGQIVGKTGYFLGLGPQPDVDAAEAYATLFYKGEFTELGERCSIAVDINDFGQVVGWLQTGPTNCSEGVTPHAFLWTESGGIQDLGTLPGATTSVAYKINFFGQVIGSSDGLPFIWTQRAGMQDLNTLIAGNSGWVLNIATGINIWGQIVGSGTLNGQTHGFLLTPRL